eukprot:Phypoly_transcript_05095.p1 GENE.Phypoly_transcript_05095~~Phypoly_transcript_05095.p1  ORF type:complete len:473 (-),score=59.81 Phypoly_transcript_05095:612-1883(-)
MKELNKVGGGRVPAIAFAGPYIDNGKPLILVNSPELLREVGDENKFPKLRKFYDPVAVFLGDGLICSTGEKWKGHRHEINPLFYNGKIKIFYAAMAENGKRLVEHLKEKDGAAINVPDLFSVVTEKILIDSFFSGKIDPAESSALWEEGLAAFNNFALCEIILGPTFNKLLPFQKHVLAARTKLRNVLQPLIEDARQTAPLLETIQHDMLHTLVSAVDDQGNLKFTDDEIFEESLTMLFAGHDTTKNAISWTIYFLAKYPEEMKKVQKEVREELKGKMPTFDDISKLRCCRNAIQEAIRVRPPVPSVERIVEHDCELDGFFIPKGTTFWLNFIGALMDEGVWGDPYDFRPDRFNKNEAHLMRSFVPFSIGNRNCIGQRFVIIEGILLLACLAQNFTFELACEKVEANLDGTLTPKGLVCRFIS